MPTFDAELFAASVTEFADLAELMAKHPEPLSGDMAKVGDVAYVFVDRWMPLDEANSLVFDIGDA